MTSTNEAYLIALVQLGLTHATIGRRLGLKVSTVGARVGKLVRQGKLPPRGSGWRPTGEQYPRCCTIRLNDDDLQRLDALRQRRGGTRCALLRRLVRQGLAQEVHSATPVS